MTQGLAIEASSTESDRDWIRARASAPPAPGCALFAANVTAFQAPGGGENQLVQTGRWLERLGVPVRLFSPWTDRIEDARVLHLFGMSREGLALAQWARKRNVPVALSPISWFQPAALAALETRSSRRLRALAAYGLRALMPALPGWKRTLLHLAGAVLPNSQAEAHQLARLFGVPHERLHVVPNGVDPGFGMADPHLFTSRYGGRDFVFFAGRVEPRKNLLGLIEALENSGRHLMVAGDAPAGCEAYLKRCRDAGRGRVTWLGRLEADDPLLASAYQAARVFALPSWFETPGLAALEAALAGVAVVITPYGSTREYFGDLAEYARPDHPREIAQAVERCWNQGADPRLRARVKDHYLWPRAAEITAEIYERIAA